MTKDKMKMIEDIYETLSRVSQTARTFEEVAHRLYTENCRIIAEDEIVVKKSKIGMLEKTIDYLEMEKAQLNKQLETAKQEKREILQELKAKSRFNEHIFQTCASKLVSSEYIQGRHDNRNEWLKFLYELAKEHGIELED